MKISVVPRKMNSQEMSISFVLHESPRHELIFVNGIWFFIVTAYGVAASVQLSARASRHWEKVKDLMRTRGLEWRKQWHPTPVLLPGKSQGQRSLVGCSPWGC